MALTAIQQLKIIAGNPAPDEVDLLSLVQQVATVLGVNFVPENTEGNADATAYLQKFKGVISNVFRQDVNTIASLRRILIVLLGNTSYTYAQITSATDANWETFITENMPTSFEFLAGITAEEKAAYIAL